MQIIASQCIQELPPLKIIDGTSHYTCTSPAILNPRGGNISHDEQAGKTGKRNNYFSLMEFRKYIDNLPKAIDKSPKENVLSDELPKVKITAHFVVFDYMQ